MSTPAPNRAREIARITPLLFALTLLLWSSACLGQDEIEGPRGIVIGGGVALSIPWPESLGTYVSLEVERDFRLTPKPGYYPYLQDRSNDISGGHFYIALVLDDIDLRYTYNQFGWSEANVTHVSDIPLEVINNSFDDATAVYIPVESSRAESIREEMKDQLKQNLTEQELSSLQIHTLAFGLRHYLWNTGQFYLWIPWSVGPTLVQGGKSEDDINFGLDVSGGAGISFGISKQIGFDFEARYHFLVTTAPGEYQQNVNHADAVGYGVMFAIFEVFHFAEIHGGLRINFR